MAAAEKKRFDADRAALRKARPKTEDEVEKALGRRADQCMMMGETNMCMWFYATKPDPADGRDVLSVTFKNGRVFLMDN